MPRSSKSDDATIFIPLRPEPAFTELKLNPRNQPKKTVVFKCYEESQLPFLNRVLREGPMYHEKVHKFSVCRMNEFPTAELEDEYDYDTDDSGLYTAKRHLAKETRDAIDFCNRENPQMLVSNLMINGDKSYQFS
jgi:hypothetical protein